MALPGPLEYRYLTCAKVSEEVLCTSMTVVLKVVWSVVR
jgi:hypothetical protein